MKPGPRFVLTARTSRLYDCTARELPKLIFRLQAEGHTVSVRVAAPKKKPPP
jgi:hypothetical protein